MGFFRLWGHFMMTGARAYARWEIDNTRVILNDRKRIFLLCLMLLGSLLGIQIGAMVTKVVKGITIRGFFAMAVLAGFVNRAFALPAKLGEMGVIPISKPVGDLLDTIGVWAVTWPTLPGSSESRPCSV